MKQHLPFSSAAPCRGAVVFGCVVALFALLLTTSNVTAHVVGTELYPSDQEHSDSVSLLETSTVAKAKGDTFWYDMGALFLVGAASKGFRTPEEEQKLKDEAAKITYVSPSPSISASPSPSASLPSRDIPSPSKSFQPSVKPVPPKPSPPPCECTAVACNVTGSGLYGFGDNTFGQLDRLNRDNVATPIMIEAMASRNVTAFAFGWEHGIAVTSCSNDSTVVCRWGKHNYNRLGGKRCFQAGGEPQQLEDLMKDNGRSVLQVAAGRSHTIALVDDGDKGVGVFAWGTNEAGQLGTSFGERSVGNGFAAVPAWVIPTFPEFTEFEPQRIPTFDGIGTIKVVKAGSDHSAVLLDDGTLLMWGRNNYGQCGQGHLLAIVEPRVVDGSFKKVSLGFDFTVALDDWSHVVVWGDNIRGQLALANVYAYSELPRPVPYFDSLNIRDVAAGMYHAFAWSDTKVYGWGDNEFGQLGVGSRDRHVGPVEVSFFSEMKMIAMAGGRSHSAGVTSTFAVYTWGSNTEGQLGVSQKQKCSTKPSKVPTLSGKNITHVVCGYDVTFAW